MEGAGADYFTAGTITTAWQVLPWIFLLVFVALSLVYWNTVRKPVPLYLTTRTTWVARPNFYQRKKAVSLSISVAVLAVRCYISRASALPFELAWLRRFLTSTRNLKLIYDDF